MSTPSPFIGEIRRVEEQWIDYNGHFNMAYYAVLFDRAADEFLASLGMGAAYTAAARCTIFTLETHTSYVRELTAGDPVRIESRIIGHDHKRIHLVQQMFHARDGFLSCVMEAMLSHVNLEERRTAPFPPAVLSRIAAMAKLHAALPLPPQVGRVISLPRAK